jgi:glycine oxidase
MRVVIVGAGLIGSLSALRLAEAGAEVEVLERAVPGAEASSAAAGILAAQSEAVGDDPRFALTLASRDLYPSLAAHLRAQVGVDVGHRVCGVTEAARDDAHLQELAHRVHWQRAKGLRAELLDAAGLRAIEPALGDTFVGGAHFPDDGALDPGRLVKAVAQAAARAGVRFRSGVTVRGVRVEAGVARGVDTDAGLVEGDTVLVAAGAWSGMVGGALRDPALVRPARGQLVALEVRPVPLNGVVFVREGYLVPRAEGEVIAGSTLEFVGYERGVTARGLSRVLDLATRTAPRLADAVVARSWSNFRPHSADGAPVVGIGEAKGLLVATGHHRSGIVLAPITAEIVRDLALKGETRWDAQTWAPR